MHLNGCIVGHHQWNFSQGNPPQRHLQKLLPVLCSAWPTLTHLTVTLPAFGVVSPVGLRLTDALCLVFLPALPTPGNSPINGPDQNYPTAATTTSNCRPFHIFCHFMFSVVSNHTMKSHPPTHSHPGNGCLVNGVMVNGKQWHSSTISRA